MKRILFVFILSCFYMVPGFCQDKNKENNNDVIISINVSKISNELNNVLVEVIEFKDEVIENVPPEVKENFEEFKQSFKDFKLSLKKELKSAKEGFLRGIREYKPEE